MCACMAHSPAVGLSLIAAARSADDDVVGAADDLIRWRLRTGAMVRGFGCLRVEHSPSVFGDWRVAEHRHCVGMLTRHEGRLPSPGSRQTECGPDITTRQKSERLERPEVPHDGRVTQPPVTDYRAIIDALRRHGSVHYPQAAVPGEFAVWRRRLRQVARLGKARISVSRGIDYVLIENLDFEVSEEDSLATTDVIEAHILGRDLTFD